MTRRRLWALFFLALTSPFWDLGHPLLEVDDARYAEVPRAMALSGDWGTPRLNDLEYVEKPPLGYWLPAASFKLFGVSEAAARLPLAVLAVLGMLGVLWLGAWLYSLETGLLAATVLGSSGLYFFLSHYITPDLPLTVTLLWCSAMILRALERPEDGRWAGPCAWVFLALAFLSKGLVAALFAGGWTVLLLLLYPQYRKGLRGLLHPLGPALFLAVTAPWFFLMEKRHVSFFHFFFTEQHFQRFLTPKYNRGSAWFFYLLLVPATMLPWTPAALTGLAGLARRWRSEPAASALALWAAMIACFFSTSNSKLATYILPVFPHLSLLAARALLMDEEPPRWAKRLSWGLGALLLLVPLGLFVRDSLPPGMVPNTAVVVAVLAATTVLGAALLAYGRTSADAVPLGLAALTAGALLLAVFRLHGEQISARSMARAIVAEPRPGDETYVYGTYLHGLSFYTGRRVEKVLNWTGELHYAKRDPANASRFGGDEAIRALPLPGRRVFVVLRAVEASYFASLTAPGEIKSTKAFGPWVLAEF